MSKQRFCTLIHSNTKEYLHIVANQGLATGDHPMILMPETTMLDLKKQAPEVDFSESIIIDITMERRGPSPQSVLGEKDRVMSVFPQRMTSCPICKTSEDGKSIMVHFAETEESGLTGIMPVHIDCLARKLVYYKYQNLIALPINEEKE